MNQLQPILLYCATIWGLYGHREISNIQNRAGGFFLSVPRNASNCAVQGELGWRTCLTQQQIESFRCFVKLYHMSEDRLTNKVFRWSMNRKGSFSFNLVKLGRQWLLYDTLLSPTSGINCKISVIKQRLCRLDEEKWFSELLDDVGKAIGNKLRTYRLFKKDCRPELYVRYIISRHRQSNLSKLRCGILPLNIEIGFYSKPPTPINQRLCPFCDSAESEAHFLVNCAFYHDLNIDEFSFSPDDSNHLKFIMVMNTTEIKVLKLVAYTINDLCYKKKAVTFLIYFTYVLFYICHEHNRPDCILYIFLVNLC
ncbi:uncharacterized protein LOC124268826 [Haliotis rubra]|uniref:uncharacterized protein LOC124268826 n=1 Tax=Haliotis rubra TaxID=36100 RepID=UPI001EE5F748|nr:uncharacterized protein LOC124268826 [Haliotis rubra]XP_046559797.1 uncharacterized protein LOC124268826 [Haliotis rubra]